MCSIVLGGQWRCPNCLSIVVQPWSTAVSRAWTPNTNKAYSTSFMKALNQKIEALNF